MPSINKLSYKVFMFYTPLPNAIELRFLRLIKLKIHLADNKAAVKLHILSPP